MGGGHGHGGHGHGGHGHSHAHAPVPLAGTPGGEDQGLRAVKVSAAVRASPAAARTTALTPSSSPRREEATGAGTCRWLPLMPTA